MPGKKSFHSSHATAENLAAVLPPVSTVEWISPQPSDDKMSSQQKPSTSVLHSKASHLKKGSQVQLKRPPNKFDILWSRINMKMLVPKHDEIKEFLDQD